MLVYYWIPSDQDDAEHPNAFPIQKTAGELRLKDIKARFPLPGHYHFRFKLKMESGAHVWMDITNDDAQVPSHKGIVFAKVLRISWTGSHRDSSGGSGGASTHQHQAASHSRASVSSSHHHQAEGARGERHSGSKPPPPETASQQEKFASRPSPNHPSEGNLLGFDDHGAHPSAQAAGGGAGKPPPPQADMLFFEANGGGFCKPGQSAKHTKTCLGVQAFTGGRDNSTLLLGVQKWRKDFYILPKSSRYKLIMDFFQTSREAESGGQVEDGGDDDEGWKMPYIFLGSRVYKELFIMLTGISSRVLTECRAWSLKDINRAHKFVVSRGGVDQDGAVTVYVKWKEWLTDSVYSFARPFVQFLRKLLETWSRCID
uniref:DIX domain-containing protein n=1 Tax=Chromera velia CCMP2878 TaxID=1169474 RepID=A0A0G4F173_9ALVE|eukprot:Cvel_14476.t1-p1 / transcript=Cvel_14476.t1 / gene=Cvel_14476 / organism=Chromera_velia_CCMP2878 / gene_product=hypothetical protein / transcript_product=hypothetical protein / location=Cvel_scaffold1031:17846-33582(-) / protein_length=371 / sequence_SO=supercontig / SO=protein_coding / is_pseudo=false